MATIKFTLANAESFSNTFTAVLLGKNGFQSNFGGIKLLANSVSVVDSDPTNRPNGNIQFEVVGFNQLHDYNFDKHLLAVNDISGSVRGDDYLTVPVNDKSADIAQENFVGFLPSVHSLSYNIAGYDVNNNYIKVVNDHAGDDTLFTKIPEPPFYVSFSQIIDKRYLLGPTTPTRVGWRSNTASAGNVYITGSTRKIILENNVSEVNGVRTLPLGVTVKDKNFIKFYVDGIEISSGDYTFTADTDTINYDFTGSVGSQQRARTEATYYTTPAIEVGDNIALYTGNIYSVANVSYDPSYDGTGGYPNDYNATITANTVYRISLNETIRANVGGRTITNITNDPQGSMGNVHQGNNNVTFDYNASTYPSNWNLANNQIYELGTRLNFEQYFFGQPSRKIIPNVPLGLNAVRARNKNSAGRFSPYTTHSVVVKHIPIRRVENLTITESLYLDTTRGIATRATISFDVIDGQSVTDYEISYKISGSQTIGGVDQLTPLTSFNTVKVNTAGVDEDGKIRFTIQNVDRLTSGAVTLFARVTPMNKEIRGTSAEISQVIIGKTAQPSNVSTFIVGQNDNNLVFNWQYPTKVDGTLVDLDLEHVEIRRTGGEVDTQDQEALAAAFNRSPQIALISPPSTNVITPVPNYGLSTYIAQTIDTSGNRSAVYAAYQFTPVRPPDLQVFKAFSEAEPDKPFARNSLGELVTNSNAGEADYPSLNSTLRDGLVFGRRLAGPSAGYVVSTHTDNSNGSASGWSSTADTDDIVATGESAEYVTQIRDMGSNVIGKVLMNVVSDVTTINRWDADAQFGEPLFTGTSEPGLSSKVLVDHAVITNQPGNKGIGHYLMNNIISSAETVAFDNFITKSLTSNSTDITGSVATLGDARTFTGNVYAIWTPATATNQNNANSFALIANVINSNAIELGNVYHPVTNAATSAYRFFQTSNSMQNLTQNAATYQIVNLAQFLDVPATTFRGDPTVVSTNLEFRLSTGNVWLGTKTTFPDTGSNGNVATSKFINFNVASGFLQAQTSDQRFRYLQVRLQVTNRAPTSNDFSLDEMNYTIDLKDKQFKQRKVIQGTNVVFDYSSQNFRTNPAVVASVSNAAIPILPVVSNIGLTAAHVNCYFSANGVAVDHTIPGNLPYVTIEAVGI